MENTADAGLFAVQKIVFKYAESLNFRCPSQHSFWFIFLIFLYTVCFRETWPKISLSFARATWTHMSQSGLKLPTSCSKGSSSSTELSRQTHIISGISSPLHGSPQYILYVQTLRTMHDIYTLLGLDTVTVIIQEYSVLRFTKAI
jgi:hypothetical protein